jgi:hypothetical protein
VSSPALMRSLAATTAPHHDSGERVDDTSKREGPGPSARRPGTSGSSGTVGRPGRRVRVTQRVPSAARPTTSAGTTAVAGASSSKGSAAKATGPVPGRATSSTTSTPVKATATASAAPVARAGPDGSVIRSASPRPARPWSADSKSQPPSPATGEEVDVVVEPGCRGDELGDPGGGGSRRGGRHRPGAEQQLAGAGGERGAPDPLEPRRLDLRHECRGRRQVGHRAGQVPVGGGVGQEAADAGTTLPK